MNSTENNENYFYLNSIKGWILEWDIAGMIKDAN